MLKAATLLATGALVVMPTLSLADAIDDAIDARRGYYQVVKHNAGMLFGMAKGDVAYDAEKAAGFARNLETLSKLDNSAMWPPGSSNADRPGKTRALPEIWSTWPAVSEKGDAYKEAVATIAETAGGGLDSLRANIGALGGACKACHDDFRAKNF